MAASENAHDSRRSRHERHERHERHAPPERHDSFRQSREYHHMKPVTGQTSGGRAHSRVGEDARDGRSSHHNEQRDYKHHHTYRYGDSASLTPHSARSTARSRSRSQQRYTWPPPPTCEDVRLAFGREKDGQRRLHLFLENERRSQSQSPGTIDQDPVILDVQQRLDDDVDRSTFTSTSNATSAHNSVSSTEQPKESQDASRERRAQGKASSPKSKTPLATPPSSEDERLYKRHEKKPQPVRKTVEDKAPEVSKRASAPYAFTKPTHVSLGDAAVKRPVASGLLSPLATGPTGRVLADMVSKSQPASPRMKQSSPFTTRPNDYFSARFSHDDDAIDDTDDNAYEHTTRHRPAQHDSTPKRHDVPRSPRSPLREFPPNIGAKVRRNTDNASSAPLPKLQTAQPRRPSPLGGTSALGDTTWSTPTSGTRPEQYTNSTQSRNGESIHWTSQRAPALPPHGRNLPTPPRSPRASTDTTRSYEPSRQSSYAAPSYDDSRPPSSLPRSAADSARLPSASVDWSAIIAEDAARRPKAPSSRNSMLSRQNSLSQSQRQSSGNDVPAQKKSICPYPEDDTNFMGTWIPSDIDRHYSADVRGSLNMALPRDYRAGFRTESPTPQNMAPATSQNTASLHVPRPPLASYHSAVELSRPEAHVIPARTKGTHHRMVSFSTSADTRSDLQTLLKKSLPVNCRRQKSVAGYRDWYTLQNATSLKFCPDCVGDHVSRTQFHRSFYPATSYDPSEKFRCALGSNRWIRLAWLLTILRRRDDLDLLKHVARYDSERACPGEKEEKESWYGLRDQKGTDVIDGFYVCQTDVKKINYLFFTLSREFVPLPHSSRERLCSMRTEGNRFESFANKMIEIHDKAMAENKRADVMRLIHHVEDRSLLPECRKDSMLRGNSWHFMPDVPHFTVCEDCYHTIVQPEIQSGSALAKRFIRYPRQIHVENYSDGCTDFSCQLYSTRMRDAFKKAANKDDVTYLWRKAKDRRDAEVKLQARYHDLKWQEEKLTDNGMMSDEENRRLNRELDRITDEWQNQWE